MTTKASAKFATKDSIFKSYRQTTVELSGAETLRIRYKAPSTRTILSMQELGRAAEAGDDQEATMESWGRLANLVSEHLVDESGDPLCEAEELMDAPLDLLLALVQAITPKLAGAADEVAAQGEG